jgi:hypothetical protein
MGDSFYTENNVFQIHIFSTQQIHHAWLCFCFRQKNVAILCAGKQFNRIRVLVLQQANCLSKGKAPLEGDTYCSRTVLLTPLVSVQGASVPVIANGRCS